MPPPSAKSWPILSILVNLGQLNYRKKCTPERLNVAAESIKKYIDRKTYLTGCKGYDGDVVKYSGLTENGSLVILEGVKPFMFSSWQSAHVKVINMTQEDKGLVKLLKDTAIKTVREFKK